MAHYTRYSGAFLSKAGVAWRVDIWQEASQAFSTVGELNFPPDEPVVIEWESRPKEEPICGSSCTVKVISESDRAFADLYTVTPGEIGVKIYRKARGASDYSLYWMGALDAEQYEEPYERAWGYDVMLTFQDFGAWGRLRYNLEGMQNMAEVLIDACQRVGLGDMVHTDETTLLDYSSFVSSMHIDETPSGGNDPEYPDSDIADDFTPSDQEGRIRPIYHYVPEGSEEVDMDDATVGPAWLETMAVQSAAFYDDGGEGMTLDEVITAMLQPLAMRIVQRNGRLWVYDINALAVIEQPIPTPIDWQEPPGFPKPITWTGDSQTLSTDAVYNKVKVTFDPKADGTLLDKDVEVEGADDLSVNTREDAASHVVEPYTYTLYSSYEKSGTQPVDPTDLNFSIIFSTRGSGLAHIKEFYYKLVGLLGGSDASGVMGFFIYEHQSLNSIQVPYRHGGMPQADTVLMRTERVYIPPIARRLASDKRYMLRIQLDILADPRYNPFEEKGSYNEEDNYGDTEARCGYAMAPCSLKLWDSKTGGAVKWHYDNRPVASRLELGSDTRISLSQALGSWSSEYGSGVNDDSTAHACCWLSWYDNSAKDDRENTQAIIGWHTNHQTIGLVNGHLRSDISELPAGQYIPYPPDGGWLELTVWDGLAIIDSPDNMSDAVSPYPIANLASRAVGTTIGSEWNVLRHLRWLLYKAPKIDVVWGKGGHDVVSIDEIVTERDALTGAENDLEIDLTCGTVGKDLPSARGQIYRIATFLPLRQLTRCGVTDTPERLLARTLCAQYGRRQTMLSGEAALTADDPHLWTDANRPGKKMLMLGEVQNLIEDTTDVELCDVVNDAADDPAPPAIFMVTTNLTHVTSNAPASVTEGTPLIVQLTAATGYNIGTVVVTMGETDITSSAYDSSTGVISIASVTDAVSITAAATAKTYNVTASLDSHTSSDAPSTATYGTSLSVQLTAAAGYHLSTVSVLMNLVDVTSQVYNSSTGVISIASVTGAIIITASSEQVLPYDAVVEYLHSSGTQRIDTGIIPDATTYLEVDANISSVGGSSCLIGCRVQSSAPNATYMRLSIYITTSNRVALNVYNYDSGWKTKSGVTLFDNRHIYSYIADELKVDDNVYVTKQNAAAPNLTDTPSIGLLRSKNYDGSWNNDSNRSIIGDIYGCRIWKGGALVCNYVPVRKDNVGYLYDTVSGELFRGVDGYGDFTYGNDVTT